VFCYKITSKARPILPADRHCAHYKLLYCSLVRQSDSLIVRCSLCSYVLFQLFSKWRWVCK